MGAFDNLIPQNQPKQKSVPTTSRNIPSQQEIADESLSKKSQMTGKPYAEQVDSNFEEGSVLTQELLKLLGDVAKTTEGLAVTGLRGLTGQKQNVPTNIGEALKPLLGIEETSQAGELATSNRPTFAQEWQKQGIDPKKAEVLGALTSMITDPLTYVGIGGASKIKQAGKLTEQTMSAIPEVMTGIKQAEKIGAKEIPLEVIPKKVLPVEIKKSIIDNTLEESQNVLKQTDELITPRKTFDDYQVQIDALKQDILKAGDKPTIDLLGGKALRSKPELVQELDDLKAQQIINEMSDYKNDISKRTIFPNPNPMTSLVQTYVANKGEFGKAVYRQMSRASDTLDALRAKWFTSFDEQGDLGKVFGGLSREEKNNFMATMEGHEQAVSPNVQNLVNVAKRNRTEIANGAIERGIQVKDVNTNTAKFFSIRQNHMPHYPLSPLEVAKDAEVVRDSLNYAVKTGKFRDLEEAQQVWDAYSDVVRSHVDGLELPVNEKTKPFYEWMVKHNQAEDIPDAIKRFNYTTSQIKSPKQGSLETSRLVDVPFYSVDPEYILSRYYTGVAKRFGEVDNFGRNDDIINTLLDGLRKENPTDKNVVQNVKDMIDLQTGIKRPSQLGAGVAKAVQNLEAARKLSLSVFMNATQTANPAAVTGLTNTVKAVLNSFNREGQNFAYKAGVLFNETARSLYQVEGTGITAKIADAVLSGTGFNVVERQNRIISALAGKHFAEEQAMKYIASDGTNKVAERMLRNLGLHPDAILKRGSVVEDELFTAARNITNRTQFRNRVIDSPVWANSPWGKVANQFKHVAENQVRFFREELINEMKQGNYAPLIRYAMIAPPAFKGSQLVKDFIKGKKAGADTRSTEEQMLQIASNTGVMSMYYDILQSVNFKGQGWAQSLIPAGDTAGQLGSAVYEMFRPVIERELGDEDARYLNLKPITRFAVKSIPIAGPRILESMKSPEEKQQEATRTIREAMEKGLDVDQVIRALKEDNRINTPKAVESAKKAIKGSKRKAQELRQFASRTDPTTALLVRLGLKEVPKKKR